MDVPTEPALDFERYRARRVRARLEELVDALLAAIERRDLQGVWDVIDEATAVRSFPAGVREEALAMVRLPRASLRAPMKLYQFHEQLRRLDDEPLEWGDPAQLDLPLSGAVRRSTARAHPSRTRSGGT